MGRARKWGNVYRRTGLRICKIWDSEYPWDVRAAKVASALTNAGHEVHLVARNRTARPTREDFEEATVHRLRPLPLGRLDAALQFPAFFNPRWFSLVHSTARDVRADIILVRDLPLAPLAIEVGRRLRLPVVLDMAENYPAMMSSIFDAGVAKPIDWIVRNPSVVRAVERWVLRRIDHVLVVVEESRDRLIALGLDAERISVVSNTPPLARVNQGRKAHSVEQPLHLVYLGLLEAPRGMSVVLNAAALCARAGLNIRVTVIGSGRERRELELKAADLALPPGVVDFVGFLENSKALQIIANADVGLVPHLATDSWNSTIPNKLFDYMAAGLPVISSSARPAARVLRETGAGVVYDHDSPNALFEAIGQMVDPVKREEFAANGRRAVQERYNWEYDTAMLLRAVDGLTKI
jgi:glycosyltransferase involved in cell wall biosynthesis